MATSLDHSAIVSWLKASITQISSQVGYLPSFATIMQEMGLSYGSGVQDCQVTILVRLCWTRNLELK